jgi:aerobic carbon-monoxide dehydrogenase large subunit
MGRIALTMIGRSPRREDLRFLTGKGCYVADISSSGQLHMVLVRSPIAHGVVKSLNITRAGHVPGVVAIVTGEDLLASDVGGLPTAWSPPGRNGTRMVSPRWPVLAQGTVRHCGEALAAIAAGTLAAAQDAARLIELEVEELPAVTDCTAALEPGAPVIHAGESDSNLCLDFEFGDAAATEEAL